jgi:hypothetical protein
MGQCENEWDYDTPERVARVVAALAPREDNLSTLLHLRWAVAGLMRVVKLAHLIEPELVSLVAILAPAAARPVINGWDYDVRDRVAEAARCEGGAASDLCRQVRDLMQTVKLSDLSVPELAAMLAVLAPPNGWRLLAATVEKTLRPILRLVDDCADLGNAAAQLVELGADLPNQFAGADLVSG